MIMLGSICEERLPPGYPWTCNVQVHDCAGVVKHIEQYGVEKCNVLWKGIFGSCAPSTNMWEDCRFSCDRCGKYTGLISIKIHHLTIKVILVEIVSKYCLLQMNVLFNFRLKRMR